jgi:hypothetical protein
VLSRLRNAWRTHAYAAIRGTSFVTAEGATYAYGASMMGNDPEMTRHALAIYELELSGGQVKSFKPAIVFDESIFVAPFMGQVFEGKISRRDTTSGHGQFAFDATLPVRIEIVNETVSPAEVGFQYEAKAVITNLDHAVTAEDGSCMPALSSYGAESPFDAGATVVLGAGRVRRRRVHHLNHRERPVDRHSDEQHLVPRPDRPHGRHARPRRNVHRSRSRHARLYPDDRSRAGKRRQCDMHAVR